MKTLHTTLLKMPTYRLELFNAVAMIAWALSLTYGSYRGVKTSDIQLVTPLSGWIAVLLIIGLFQIVGVLYGVRLLRAIAATLSGIVLLSLVCTVAKRGYLFPFVSFGTVWSIGQYVSLYYIISVQKVTAVLPTCRKVEDIDSRESGVGSSGSSGRAETLS